MSKKNNNPARAMSTRKLTRTKLEMTGCMARAELSVTRAILNAIRTELFDKESLRYKDEATVTFVFDEESRRALLKAIREI